MVQQQQLPNASDISITDRDVKDANSRKKYSPGWYRWTVLDATNKVSDKKGSLMTVAKLAALKDPEDASSAEKLTINHYVVHPLRNPSWPGHKTPRTAGMIASFYRASGVKFDSGDELEDYARMNEARTWERDGEEISKEDALSHNEEVTRKVLELSLEVWADPSRLLNGAPFAKLFYEQGSDWPSLTGFRSELPDDAVLVEPEAFFEEGEEEVEPEFVEETPPAKAAKSSNGHTNKKAPAKKGKR